MIMFKKKLKKFSRVSGFGDFCPATRKNYGFSKRADCEVFRVFSSAFFCLTPELHDVIVQTRDGYYDVTVVFLSELDWRGRAWHATRGPSASDPAHSHQSEGGQGTISI